ncbi:MAG: non-homologous end-joining DNA ligase [Kineosporiaceae bacterium]|nr:non-homologous end-joining DNA ligase [Kineosporiaceae bacterium]
MQIAGREVTITNPGKIVFPALGLTKLELIEYYLAVADGALRGVRDRPMVLKRFVKGIAAEAFFQKRAPEKRPDWVRVARLNYARGTFADEAVVDDAAGLAWAINLGCVDLNPHPVRSGDLDHPDELRIDLDPMPGVTWEQILDVAHVVHTVLTDHGLTAWPKTSGSRGFHIYSPIAPHWPYPTVRLAAQTVAREVELRAPDLATSKWWKEERQGVFVDFNQNAKDRTVASAYSVRATPDARVSTPLRWDEVAQCRPEMFTVRSVAARFGQIGDPWQGMQEVTGSLDALLERADALGPAEKPPRGSGHDPTAGRRRPQRPLLEIARAKTRQEAMAGYERWATRHPAVASQLAEIDVLVDGMRGRSSLWYRIRVNLQHVPEADRPEQEPLEVDYDPWEGIVW